MKQEHTMGLFQEHTKYTRINRNKYAQRNRPIVTKPNPENGTNGSSKCAYDCAQLQYAIQHRTVLIISPLTSRKTLLLRCCLSEESGGRRWRGRQFQNTPDKIRTWQVREIAYGRSAIVTSLPTFTACLNWSRHDTKATAVNATSDVIVYVIIYVISGKVRLPSCLFSSGLQ